MKWVSQRYIKKFWSVVLLLLPLILYATPHFLRPPRSPETRSLFQGITYQREVRSVPRPIVIHLAIIDLTAPGIRVFVTPGTPTPAPPKTEMNARTVSQFVREFNLQLAVNANFFYPFHEGTPWDYFPRVGDRVNNVGQATSNGNTYSPSELNRVAICFSANNRAQISESGTCPIATVQAVAGNDLLVKQGKSVKQRSESQDEPYPRVAAAIDARGEKLWLILVDGKQRLYSEGMTLTELAEFVQQLGAETALNLDGGGSVTLVTGSRSGAKVLNAPIHTKVPMRERPVANHLGFYARP